MKGVNNKLAMKHVPWVLPRNDTIAGPYGRRGDMVGGFCMMRTDDLKRVAPLWLSFSRAVRNDPDVSPLTSEVFILTLKVEFGETGLGPQTVTFCFETLTSKT